MSGHSKWSKVKHQKASTDALKASAFTKASRAIAVAVRDAGGVTDPDNNYKLRLAIEKAREVNMPKENIERAIAKGKGAGGEAFESLLYEAYGPSGVGLVIEATTENKQRTVSVIKNILERGSGTLASPGSVLYQFRRLAVLVIDTPAGFNEDLLLEAALDQGALDVVPYGESTEVFAEPEDLERLRRELTNQGFSVNNAEIIYHPTTTMTYPEPVVKTVDRLVESLTDLEDVQNVYTTMSNS
jgi:YebC/PmpR family DNA-binding regulatory protein